ncbi:tRNA (N6-isopentenyl adenosine(37)-C2)-methylthiotransferase MiaB, partial [Spirochaetota bacterium]
MKFFIETYGCQMNVSDSDNLIQLLLTNNFTRCDKADDADIIIINTCAVRTSAEERIWGRLGFYKSLKNKRDFILVLIGCIAQEKKEDLFRDFPFIDIVIGTGETSGAALAIMHYMDEHVQKAYTNEDSHVFLPESPSLTEPFSAYINITHGCDNYCTYCIVPFVRGRMKSRKADEIIREINALY